MSAPYGLTKIWDPEGSGSPELLYVMWYLTEDQKHLGMWAFVHSYPPQSDILYWTKGNTINKPFELTKWNVGQTITNYKLVFGPTNTTQSSQLLQFSASNTLCENRNKHLRAASIVGIDV